MTRPTESDYTSHVSYCRALEEYTDEVETVLLECREAMQKAKYSGTPYTSRYNNALAKMDEVLNVPDNSRTA